MATTIQLKRGTGSAVPTGLADGELAINLDNGKLFFGSGSTSINSFRFENLTAENYIVSSSVTNITTQELSGSTNFGDTADDAHTFTGAITASGDISSSGTLTAAAAVLTTADINGGTIDGITSLTAGGNLDIGTHDLRAATLTADGLTSGRVIFAGTAGVLSDDADLTFATDTLTVTKIANVNSTSHITASGNISSSGTITGNSIVGTLGTAAQTNITSLGTLTALTVDGDIDTSGNNITMGTGEIDGAGSVQSLVFKGIEDQDLTIKSDGNITFVLDDDNDETGQSFSFKNDNTEIANLDESGNLQLDGHITASGNISSSGTIIAATLDAAAVSDTLAAAIVAEIDNDEIPIAKLAEDAVTVTAGTGLTGGGSITLGGSATVNVIGGTGVTANANDIAIGQDVATTANVQFANITSSANISSSHAISAFQINLQGEIIRADGDFIDIPGSGLIVTKGIQAESHITASGNIKANGDIIGDDTTDITNIRYIYANRLIHNGDTDTKIAFGTDTYTLDVGGTTQMNVDVTGSTINSVHQNVYDTGSLALSGNGGAIGDIVKFGGFTTVAGGIYALTGSDWSLASATSTATGATSSLAVALGTNPASDGMCLRGFINPFNDPSAPLGNPLFLNTTVGRFSSAAPSSTNNVVRILGYQYGTDLIYFNPSNDYIVHE